MPHAAAPADPRAYRGVVSGKPHWPTMLMTTPYPVFIRVTSVGCPLRMLRAGNFRNPSLACVVMKMQTRDTRISGVGKNIRTYCEAPPSSSRAYLAATHILEPRFTKVIPG